MRRLRPLTTLRNTHPNIRSAKSVFTFLNHSNYHFVLLFRISAPTPSGQQSHSSRVVSVRSAVLIEQQQQQQQKKKENTGRCKERTSRTTGVERLSGQHREAHTAGMQPPDTSQPATHRQTYLPLVHYLFGSLPGRLERAAEPATSLLQIE